MDQAKIKGVKTELLGKTNEEKKGWKTRWSFSARRKRGGGQFEDLRGKTLNRTWPRSGGFLTVVPPSSSRMEDTREGEAQLCVLLMFRSSKIKQAISGHQ